MIVVNENTPVIDVFNNIITEAIKQEASDIHLEILADGLRIRFRVDGILQEFIKVSSKIQNALLSRVKIISDLDISERRMPQDGRMYLTEYPNLDIRVSTLPTIYGEKIVLRILNKQAIHLQLQQMDFSNENLTTLLDLCKYPHGMILATGPTGSGKTTTLHSLLMELNDASRNLVTIEDPVEYRLSGVNQIQVNQKAGLNFAKGLRAILRQDPNIVMVGEIRDTETAEIAIRSALTGHLVLSTLHTNDAVGALPRLLDMGVEDFLVSSAILAVISQRLVRKICPCCKVAYNILPNTVESIFLQKHGVDIKTRFYKGTGCAECRNTGYKGRMPVQEVLPVTPAIRTAIMQRKTAGDILVVAEQQGFKKIAIDGINKAIYGQTSLSEIIRIAYSI